MRFEGLLLFGFFVCILFAFGFISMKPFPKLLPTLGFLAIASGLLLPVLAKIKLAHLAGKPMWTGYYWALGSGLLLIVAVFLLRYLDGAYDSTPTHKKDFPPVPFFCFVASLVGSLSLVITSVFIK